MEDRSNPIPPSATDSLGRSVGILRNFSQCSDNFLLNIKNSLCLEMELHELKACRDSYSRSKRNDISLSTLYLFDGIVKGAKKLSVNKAIDDAFFGGLDIFDTYKDMFEKHCLLCGEDISPLSLNSAANVGPRYMSMIGLPCQGKNEFPSFLEENTAFSIILPTTEMSLEEYELLIKKLVFEQDISDKILRLKMIDSRGIAAALSDMAVGIFADIYSIPSISEHPELSQLATDYHSRYIIASKKEDLPLITEFAEGLGVSVSYFAKAISKPIFSLLQHDHISLTTDINLIRELGCSKSPQAFDLTDDSNGYFLAAVNSAVDAIMPVLAEGADIQSVVLSSDYTFSQYADKKLLGDSLATILGVYRVVCELCIPNTCKIRYSGKASLSLSVNATLKEGEANIPSSFLRPFSGVYLLSFDHTENGLPDFESLRGMTAFIKELNSCDAIISAKAVQGSVSETLDAMQTTLKIVPDAHSADLLSSSAKGIIVESAIPLSTGILLGSVSEI